MTSARDRDRVLVTGIGLYTGLGNARELTWSALRRGASGFRRLGERFDAAPAEFCGCPIRHSDHRPNEHLFKAAIEAIADAGIRRDSAIDRDRVATILGHSKGDLLRQASWHRMLVEQGPGAL